MQPWGVDIRCFTNLTVERVRTESGTKRIFKKNKIVLVGRSAGYSEKYMDKTPQKGAKNDGLLGGRVCRREGRDQAIVKPMTNPYKARICKNSLLTDVF